jgi:alpha-galactosidase
MLNLAQIPHMGWNSYTSFGIDINTAKVMRAADVIVASGMADAGYEYIVVDDGWQMARDANGKIVAGFIRFLKGIKHLEDYVQSKALKFGICTDTGTETCRSLPGK